MSQFDAKPFLKTLTHRPGVYRMLNGQGSVLYVGKARDLKRRLASYFRASGLPIKTHALMAQVHHIEVTVLHRERSLVSREQSHQGI